MIGKLRYRLIHFKLWGIERDQWHEMAKADNSRPSMFFLNYFDLASVCNSLRIQINCKYSGDSETYIGPCKTFSPEILLRKKLSAKNRLLFSEKNSIINAWQMPQFTSEIFCIYCKMNQEFGISVNAVLSFCKSILNNKDPFYFKEYRKPNTWPQFFANIWITARNIPTKVHKFSVRIKFSICLW